MLPSLPLSRASEMIASGLPISGAMPKSPLKAVQRRTGDVVFADQLP